MTACVRASAEAVAVGAGFHSRAVAILKVGLPLVALGLLSALFLIPYEDGPRGELVFTKGDMAALGSGLRISGPTFTGVTRGEDRFRFTADLVVPDAAPPTRASISNLSGNVEFTSGLRVDLTAETAEADIEGQRLELLGDVGIETSDGYKATAPRMDLDLRSGVLEAAGPVEAHGPMGEIVAGSLRIAPGTGAGAGRMISFGNGVRLVYRPPGGAER